MVDQTRLPDRYEVMRIESVPDMVAAISSNCACQVPNRSSWASSITGAVTRHRSPASAAPLPPDDRAVAGVGVFDLVPQAERFAHGGVSPRVQVTRAGSDRTTCRCITRRERRRRDLVWGMVY